MLACADKATDWMLSLYDSFIDHFIHMPIRVQDHQHFEQSTTFNLAGCKEIIATCEFQDEYKHKNLPNPWISESH